MDGLSLSLAGHLRGLIKARHTKTKSNEESPARISLPHPHQCEGVWGSKREAETQETVTQKHVIDADAQYQHSFLKKYTFMYVCMYLFIYGYIGCSWLCTDFL